MADEQPHLTPRAYTLQLHWPDKTEQSWRSALWATHKAVNRGVQFFGDWLLTLRGGLCHLLATGEAGAGRAAKDSRVLLALCWLSVESAPGEGDRHAGFVVATGRESPSIRHPKVVKALRQILKKRGLPESQIDGWVEDCSSSLSAVIKDDAVWVNRSEAFDAARRRIPGLDRDYCAQTMQEFFGDLGDYLSLPSPVKDAERQRTTRQKAKEDPEFVKKARSWISSNFGTGQKSDAKSIAAHLRRLGGMNLSRWGGKSKGALIAHMARELGASPGSDGEKSLSAAIGWKSGRSSKWQLALRQLPDPVTREAIAKMQETFQTEADAKGDKHRPPPWISGIKGDIEKACGLKFDGHRDLTDEFSVLLDHAARRVSSVHSWIKRAETQRRQSGDEAGNISRIPSDARAWLDQYCHDRTRSTHALDGYRIRRRAVEGWEIVLARWISGECHTVEDQIAVVREAQDDPDIQKFGDSQLFEALADDAAQCVWKDSARPLLDYAAATEAKARQTHFKVPAYRHPDPLFHPVYCDFGQSRWHIKYSFLAPAQASKGAAAQEVQLQLWNGSAMAPYSLHWSCKRLTGNLALRHQTADPAAVGVTRNDRLGRAAAGVKDGSPIRILSVFEQKQSNGRLQAPRGQLEALGRHLARHGRDAKAQAMCNRIRWSLTFSVKLQPAGPWLEYCKELPKNDANSSTASENAQEPRSILRQVSEIGAHSLRLLPGLALLSVDLGHRVAAACAVWKTLTTRQMNAACRAAHHKPPTDKDLYLHIPESNAPDCTKKTVYRRIGSNAAGRNGDRADLATWACLERQFVIRLPGEDDATRKVSPMEWDYVCAFAREIGAQHLAPKNTHRSAPELMSLATRIAKAALKRHARWAKIAYAFSPDTRSVPDVGLSEKVFEPGDSTHVNFLADALLNWYALASDPGWNDPKSRDLWNTYIADMPDGWRVEPPKDGDSPAPELSHKARQQDEQNLRKRIMPLAQQMACGNCEPIHAAWKSRWEMADGKPATCFNLGSGSLMSSNSTGLYARLRWLVNWIAGRKLPGSNPGFIQKVGGLSLTRIATMKSLYQIQKAFDMRARPDKICGTPDKGSSNADFCLSRIRDMERLREQRVKLLVHRIIAAALDVQGTMQHPCHVVVIENLKHYRPDQIRTRFENRQLMSWSAGKIDKFLLQACELYGLKMQTVSAAFTSRQDSRTGAPGMRCRMVSLRDFMTAAWWRKRVEAAKSKAKMGKATENDRYMQELDARYSEIWNDPSGAQAESMKRKSLLIPDWGGGLFVSADPDSPAAKGLHADLNAAANIGLRAIMDPEWAGSQWRIFRDSKTHRTEEKTKTSQASDRSTAHGNGQSARPRKFNGKCLWRDVTSLPINDERATWSGYAMYWEDVALRVVRNLKRLQKSPLKAQKMPN